MTRMSYGKTQTSRRWASIPNRMENGTVCFYPKNSLSDFCSFHYLSIVVIIVRSTEGLSTLHASWDRSHGRVPPPPPRHQTWDLAPTNIWWFSLDLFKLHLRINLSPLVLTSSGGHKNTHGWQAGSTHFTGMLSCLDLFFTSKLSKTSK